MSIIAPPENRITRVQLPSADSLPQAARWKSVAVNLSLALAAGTFHGLAWLYPGVWLPVWFGQAAFVAVALRCRPRVAFVYGMLGGAIGIACSFYWGIKALELTI